MSRPSDAPNDLNSARRFVAWLGQTGVFSEILLGGSRSPLRQKQPHEHSDWDLVGVSNVGDLKMVGPRTGNRLHGDLLIIQPNQVQNLRKHVQVWPQDTHGVLQ